MIKKILPIVAVIGASVLTVSISNSNKEKHDSFISNINSFKNDVMNYSGVSNSKLVSTALNKYTLSVETEDLNSLTNTIDDLNEENNEINTLEENESENNIEKIENKKFSTLYSISNDIENSCDDFCSLKEDITKAIIETQNLINKVQQKEIELTREQRMFISEQSAQLKNLGKQLSNITTELSINLSDLSQIMATNGHDIDNLSLKYLIVLDNLVNGNEMLQSGLSSLNLINQMFNMNNNNYTSNNPNRILYGFQKDNNPPIIKEYSLNEQGEIVENQKNDNSTETADTPNEQVEKANKTNIDSYQNSNLNTNLDTYNNNNLPRNIDTFFNTALLDNEFMYGNGNYGYGYAGINGNPYMQNYANYQQRNTTNSNSNNNNTQDVSNYSQKETNNSQTKKRKKFIKLKKNIDTFKDENEPEIGEKIGNIKKTIIGFFSKFKKSDLDDKLTNPVYRYNPSSTDDNLNG